MTRSRNQSSILAVATLGVYLGLILAGGTPVLAQRVIANVDIKMPPGNRAEVGDGLKVYLEDVEYFLRSIARLQARGKFDIAKDTFDVVQTSIQPCVEASIAGSYSPIKLVSTSDAIRPALSYLGRGMQYGYSLGDCVSTVQFAGGTAVDNAFDFHFDGKRFTTNIAVRKETPQNAAGLLKALNAVLPEYATQDSTQIRKDLVRNTTFHVANDQVFIVTRLPRGSLDKLLASDAK